MSQSFATDPAMAPWREQALKHGYQACIGVPLKIAGETFAALTLYASQPNAFDSEEVVLLVALAEDISYAVSRLREGVARAAGTT